MKKWTSGYFDSKEFPEDFESVVYRLLIFNRFEDMGQNLESLTPDKNTICFGRQKEPYSIENYLAIFRFVSRAKNAKTSKLLAI